MSPNPRRAARLAAAVLAAAACTLVVSCAPFARPATDRQLFAFDPGVPPRPAGMVVSAASPNGPALRVRRLQVASPYGGTAFVYRTAGGAFRTDYYNGFVAPPGELLTGAVVDRLARGGGFASVTDAASSVPARYVLEGNVAALYGDYIDRKAPKAVVRIKLFVLDEQARGARLVFQKEYEAAAPVQPASAPGLVDGWDKALRSVLEQVDADLRSHLAPGAVEQQGTKVDAR